MNKGSSPLILGMNLGSTRFGKTLRDGGVCILESGKIKIAIAEERVTRKKTDGGYKKALSFCLNRTGLEMSDFDQIVYSTCCEGKYRNDLAFELGLPNSDSLYPVSHHKSHASSAFYVSGFDESLIVVLDAGGNTIRDRSTNKWWKTEREQQSYYIGTGNSIELLHRDFKDPYEAGIGEIYRAFTHYLGFESYVHSGKTMGLAAYGQPNRYDGAKIFHLDNGEMVSNISNDPQNPIQMVSEFASQNGLDFGTPRDPSSPPKQVHLDVARFIQEEVERILVSKINYLIDQHDIQSLCIAGGVGLNCVANSRVWQETPVKKFFVQPAAGDSGQCLGNALFAHHELLSENESFEMSQVYFGGDYTAEKSLNNIVLKAKREGINVHEVKDDLHTIAADQMSQGKIVGWFQGRSEFGPRALGGRSILADPRNKQILPKLQRIKNRESFRPFAPSVLKDDMDKYFITKKSSEEIEKLSDFMLMTFQVKPDKTDLIPAVTHVDNSARLQKVTQSTNEKFRELIESFKQMTGIPMVLNTSFNRGGEPICETPKDAYDCFKETEMDVLIIESYIFYKKKSAEVGSSKVEMQSHDDDDDD